VLDQSGILKAAVGRLVRVFGGRKYWLLLVIAFFFMAWRKSSQACRFSLARGCVFRSFWPSMRC
jgi:hypothetical protein